MSGGTNGLGPATFGVTGNKGIAGVMERGTAPKGIAGMGGLKGGKGPGFAPSNAKTGSSSGEFGLLTGKPAMPTGGSARFGRGLPL